MEINNYVRKTRIDSSNNVLCCCWSCINIRNSMVNWSVECP